MNKTVFLICLLSLQVLVAWAQNGNTAGQNNAENVLYLEKDTIQIVDTIYPSSADRDLPLTFRTVLKDTLMYVIKDDPYNAKIDSLWMDELVNTMLYDSIAAVLNRHNYSDPYTLAELPTDTLKSRLAKLNAKTPFDVSYNPSLESVIKMYLGRNRPLMNRLVGLSAFYFPTFEETLDRTNLPLELKYLPLVESALQPRARSWAGATGMWQFMYSTGKMYDLNVSSYVDERMDVSKATDAAAAYLSRLHAMFGDWNLALAAYNSGPGNVNKAIRRSGGNTDYWSLRRHLPRETAGYVPAFLAVLYLSEYSEEHGINPEKPPFNYFMTDTVQVKQTLTFSQISQFTGIPVKQIQFLNPAYKLDIIPFVEDKNYALRLPTQAIGKFVTAENEIYATAEKHLAEAKEELPQYEEIPTSITYRVRSGDYLGKIAEKYGVGVSQLKSWNNLRSNSLRIGQRLTVYPKRPVATSTSTKKTAVGKTYVVRRGDSLWTIAKKYPGVSADNIKKWNDISGTAIRPGMTLIVSD
ncbi:MAG: LysM peptidoglycan-binding domain-containing protein [Leeuwenhoekiella sp.]